MSRASAIDLFPIGQLVVAARVCRRAFFLRDPLHDPSNQESVFPIGETAGHRDDRRQASSRTPRETPWPAFFRRLDFLRVLRRGAQADREERRRHSLSDRRRDSVDEALGRFLMLAGVERRAHERAAHVRPIDVGRIRARPRRSRGCRAQFVKHRRDPLGDAARLPFAGGEEDGNSRR